MTDVCCAAAVCAGQVEDPRIDVCLFCVPPHRLRPIDIRCAHVFEVLAVCQTVHIVAL
jgi:septin family protein